ncbi:MAG: DedA family protein [Lentisphaerae bacterium]|nr:DedA family protein [Lentisphaerota bacterium]
MLHSVIEWIVNTVGQWGYPGIVVMMFLESSCFPFPSEVVMIPAGYLSSGAYLTSPGYVAGHEMNAWAAISMGIIGSWLGALFNYYLALWLGRPLLLKWGKYLLISEKNFEKGERFFQRHGEISTFTGRLIPVVRQYVSLPAGIARMHMGHFLFFTGLGAGIWVSVLTWIGYVAGQNEALIRKYSHTATILALCGCGAIVALYVWRHRRRRAAGAV